MSRTSIAKESAHAIDTAMLDLVLGKYESAEQRFGDIVNDLADRGDRFKKYLWTAAFGCGLADGMGERQTQEEPRSFAEAAGVAKKFYDAFTDFGGKPSGLENYRRFGKTYAALGLDREGLEVLDLSRRSSILNIYQLRRSAKELYNGDVEH